SYTIRAEFIGYGTMEQQVTVAAGQTVTVNFALTVDPLSLTGLTVTATREARPAQEVAQSIQVLSSEQLERLEPTSSADA
ncbi:MAG: hypothetical protein GTO30_21035, partial [Acidobacteria bacterium]|nr:hypothetical protein [Acidobacteriota bacterium]